MTRLAAVSMWCLMLAGPAFADDQLQDLKDRRARAIAKLGSESMLVLFSAPPRVYSADVEYEYRQDSDLYYFTGITQPDTILVLMPGNQTNKGTSASISVVGPTATPAFDGPTGFRGFTTSPAHSQISPPAARSHGFSPCS